MRRPILFVFLSLMIGIAAAYFMKYGIAAEISSNKILVSAVLLSFVVFFYKCYKTNINKTQIKRTLILLPFLIAALFGAFRFMTVDEKLGETEVCEGRISAAAGTVISVQMKGEDYGKLIVKARDGSKILVTAKGDFKFQNLLGPSDLVGREVQIKGIVSLPTPARNPGGFNYALYLKTLGICTILETKTSQMKIRDTELIPFGVNWWNNRLALMKAGYLAKLQAAVSEPAGGLLAGMLFGDKNLLDETVYELFQKNGVAHILSVSGIHVGIVYAFLNKILGNRRTLLFCCLSGAILLAYAALSQFSPSVVRAAAMIAVHIVSKLCHRRYDLLCCACCCAIIMLAVNPYDLFGLGFQLSYLAVFCLAVSLPWVNRRLDMMSAAYDNKPLSQMLGLISPLVAIQAGMIPFTAYCFNYFSPAAFLLNPPVIALSGMLIPLGICLIPVWGMIEIIPAASFALEPIFGIGAAVLELLTRFMIWGNELLYSPGQSFIHSVSPPVWLLLLYYSFFFFLLCEWFRILWQRKERKQIMIVTSVIVVISILLPPVVLPNYSKEAIVFVDVGQGDCLFLRTPGGKHILIDGGGSQNYDVGKKTLLPYLLKSGVKKIDLALASHLHDDHFLGLVSLAKEIEISRLGMYASNQFREDEILQRTGLPKEAMLYLAKGDRIVLEKDVWVDVLYPKAQTDSEYKQLLAEESDENKSSLLLKVSYLGLEILMTGDMGFAGEEAVMDMYRQDGEDKGALASDILKIGHHGSKYSTSDEFLKAVSPNMAVIQVGKNNFGHPSRAVIEKCRGAGIMIMRNDERGAIMLRKGSKWHIRTMLPQSMHIRK